MKPLSKMRAYFVWCLVLLWPGLALQAALTSSPGSGTPITNVAGRDPNTQVWSRFLKLTLSNMPLFDDVGDYNISYKSIFEVANVQNYTQEDGTVVYTYDSAVKGQLGAHPEVVFSSGRSSRIGNPPDPGSSRVVESWTAHYSLNNFDLWRYNGPMLRGGPAVELNGPAARVALILALDRMGDFFRVGHIYPTPDTMPIDYTGLVAPELVRQTVQAGEISALDGLRAGSSTYWDDLPFGYADPLIASLSTPTAPSKSLQKMQYKFKLTPASPPVINWLEVFTPKDPAQAKSYVFQSWTPTPGQQGSAPYTIDPLGLDPTDANAAKRQPTVDGTWTIDLNVASLAVDANRDGTIKLASEDCSDATSATSPYRFWINEDFDGYGGFSPPTSGAIIDHSRDRIAGVNDLEDYFPVFLDIKQLLNAMPPDSGASYSIKQADGALKAVFTTLTRATAFSYKDYPYAYSNAFTYQITPEGLPLSTSFLNSMKDGDQGVLLLEGTDGSTQPLVLVVEMGGATILEISLPLSIGQDILLLLHGMNSNTNTWDEFVDSASVHSWSSVADIRDGDIWGDSPRNSKGVVCYRVQFGAHDLASVRAGLENVRSTDVGYDTVTRRCGDFETFTKLGEEVEEAITLLLDRHKNAHVVLVGHSRGGISARAFLQGPASTAANAAAKAAVVGLVTTSSPHLGSRMGRIYGWLNTHRRDHPDTDEDDWEVVDFLLGTGLPWAPMKEVLDVRRPVILDVADNSLAVADLNAVTAVQNVPTSIRCTEIQYANARFGLLNREPVRYSVFEPTGYLGGPLPQLSSEATEFIMEGGDPGGIPFVGDGLVPRANQRFTQLTGFPAIALPARVITGREVVHIEAPKQSVDLLEQLKVIVPNMFP